jgi:AcrR family transcriptional regulator
MPRAPRVREIQIPDIIDAALLEFQSKGYDGVRMVDIARRARIQRSSIYRCFPSKSALLTAVNNRLFEPIHVLMISCGSLPPLEGLRRFIEAYLKFWAAHPREQEFYLMDIVKTLRNRAAWPFINARIAEMINWYDLQLWRGVQSGQFAKHDTRARATALFTAIDGCIPYITTSKLLTIKKAVSRLDTALIADLIIH